MSNTAAPCWTGCRTAAGVLDLGSGGGLPGLVVATARPEVGADAPRGPAAGLPVSAGGRRRSRFGGGVGRRGPSGGGGPATRSPGDVRRGGGPLVRPSGRHRRVRGRFPPARGPARGERAARRGIGGGVHWLSVAPEPTSTILGSEPRSRAAVRPDPSSSWRSSGATTAGRGGSGSRPSDPSGPSKGSRHRGSSTPRRTPWTMARPAAPARVTSRRTPSTSSACTGWQTTAGIRVSRRTA